MFGQIPAEEVTACFEDPDPRTILVKYRPDHTVHYAGFVSLDFEGNYVPDHTVDCAGFIPLDSEGNVTTS